MNKFKQFVLTWIVPRGWQRLLRKPNTAHNLSEKSPTQSLESMSTVMSPEWKTFRECMESCQVYLEFGSGESTLFADKAGVSKIVSVETDPLWVSTLEKLTSSRVSFIRVDLGPVGRWGRPIDYSFHSRFSHYLDDPFDGDLQPDLVLIDGRFRVASFLATLRMVAPGSVIVFDDYVKRPEYHVVEEVLSPERVGERQAVFRRPEEVDLKKIDYLLNAFRYVMD